MDKKPDIFVFWDYDQLPKMLGSPGVMTPNGSVYAFQYEMTVPRKTIIAIYPLELGQKLWDEVSTIHHQHSRKIEELETKLRSEILRVVPEMEARWKKPET